jgi:hypothetical protein
MKQEERHINRRLWLELLFEAFVGTYVLGVVVVCWREPVLSSLLLGGSLGIQLWFWREKADAAAMVVAALLGTPSEMICVRLGVWTYHAPGVVLGLPIWIPLVWASLFCLFRRISITAISVTCRIWPDQKMLGRRLFFRILGGLIVIYYLVTVCTVMKTIAVVYTVFMISAVIFWHGERDILMFVVGAVLGTLGEYICMKLGFWHYHYPLFKSVGLPLSLALAWGLSAVIVGRIAGMWETDKEG